MYVEFIKNHPVGIEKGTCAKVNPIDGERHIENGYCKEVDESEHKAWVELFKEDKAIKKEAVATKKEEKPKESKKKE